MLSAFFFGCSMNVNIWMALALVLVLEGLGPMFMPRLWRRVILSMTQLPDRLLHRFGGGLVVAGVVIYCMLRLHGEL